MNSPIQPKQSVVCPKERLTKRKILPNTFISVGILFALTRLLDGGTNDGLSNFSNMLLVRPQPTFITFDTPGQITSPLSINPAGEITGLYRDMNFGPHGFLRIP